MPTYGLTSTGFYAKPLTTVASEVDTGLKAILGDSAGSNSDGTIPATGFAGQLKALVVDGLSAMWDLLEAFAASVDPNQATGASQDALCALSGTVRDAESFSSVTETCTGVPLTSITAGSAVTVESTGARFLALSSGTIAAATAWVALTGYSAGDIRTNSGNIYRCTASGTSAASGGPTGTSASISDGSCTWEYCGQGTGYVDIDFQADTAGEIAALAGTLTEIATPISGWQGAFNALDASVGALQETDAALRVRREEELAAPGNATPDAIRANILQVNQGSSDPAHEAPTTCTVFYNDGDFTDANGLPPHSVEILVQDGTDADIAQAVWDSVGAGTATYGNQTSVVTDSQGNSQTVRWSRPTEVPIYVIATVYYDASQWPSGSDAAVAEAALSALLTYGEGVAIGLDVRLSALMAAMMRGPSQLDSSSLAVVPAAAGSNAVPGILELSPLYFGITASPSTTTTVAISLREIATFDSSRCTITATTETP